MANYLSYLSPTLLLPLALLTVLLLFFVHYWQLALGPKSIHERILRHNGTPVERHRGKFTFAGTCHPMERLDLVWVLVLTAVYAATAFFQLGSLRNPQSFQDFSTRQPVELTLSQPVIVSKLMYYPGLGTGDYNVELSADGQHWSTLWARKDENGGVTGYYWADAQGYDPSYALPQHYVDLFKWLEITLENAIEVQFIRITGRADRTPMELGELALYGQDGGRLDMGALLAEPSPLFDEQDTVPEAPYWTNSTYFDEIYHARTAYEHVRGVAPYEISHPPLGKLILSIGIQLFGMTPFGWRFMGVLFGVLMLPVLYVFLKNLFGRTGTAVCGTAFFAFDFMHLTQTRIATIDTYGVFFILLMYWLMYRYLALPAGTSFAKGAVWLFLSGLAWGVGTASKWTVIYGGAGLALLYFLGLWFKIRDWPRDNEGNRRERLGPWLWKMLAFSVLCFVLIPACIYVLSYLPYAAAKGTPSLSAAFQEMWDNQLYMFNYHKGVHDVHPYESRWYQWVVDARPILYYLNYNVGPNLKSAFAAFSNPVVCWGGLLAVLSVAVQGVRRRCGKALFILIAYLAQLAPWFFITRTTFAYHYFPSILFLCVALAYVCNDFLELAPPRARREVYSLAVLAAVVYGAFYPVLTGLAVPRWYTTNVLQWLPSWPL